MPYASPKSITADLLGMVAPPRRVPVSQAAQDFIRVETAGGSKPWSLETAPYMAEPMDCTASLKYEQVIFAGPSRTGKTQGLVCGMAAHAAKCDPVGDMLAMFPTEKNAHKFGVTDLRKLYALSPAMQEAKSPRAHDSAITRMIHRNGFAVFLGHPTTGEVAQTTYRRVIASDYDSFPMSIGDEGDPFGLLAGRVKTFLSAGIAVAESSPKRIITDPRWKQETPHEAPPTEGGIMALYNQGDRRMWYWRCLHCRELFRVPALPDFDDLPSVEESAKTARVVCPECGCVHSPKDKFTLQTQDARWLTEAEIIRAGSGLSVASDSRIASFWLLGCAAGFQSWASLVANELRALRAFEKTGDEEGLKRTRNTDQGVPYLPASLKSTRTPDSLAEKAEPSLKRGFVPTGVGFLVVTVDTQKRSFVVQVHGFGPGKETWIIDRYTLTLSERKNVSGDPEPLDPAAYLEDWQLLATRVLPKTYPLADGSGRTMAPMFLGVDSGGEEGVSERAYAFWRWAKQAGMGQKIMLLRGDNRANEHTPIVDVRYPDLSKTHKRSTLRGDVPLYFVNGVRLGDELYADLDKAEGPGTIHYGDWMEPSDLEQLGNEIREKGRWVKVSHKARNETPDLIRYARAILHYVQCRKSGNGLAFQGWGDNWENAPQWARGLPEESIIQPKKAEPVYQENSRHAELMDRLRNRR